MVTAVIWLDDHSESKLLHPILPVTPDGVHPEMSNVATSVAALYHGYAAIVKSSCVTWKFHLKPCPCGQVRLFLQLLLTLGGKLGLKNERDGPYLLLRGFQKLLACVNTLAVFKRYRQLDALLQLLDAL